MSDPVPYREDRNPFRVGQYPVSLAEDVKEEIVRFKGELKGEMQITRKDIGELTPG